MKVTENCAKTVYMKVHIISKLDILNVSSPKYTINFTLDLFFPKNNCQESFFFFVAQF
jgi:hypothetical protein